MESEIVAARSVFRDKLPEDLKGAIEFYQPGVVNAAASVQDNVLFGRIVDTYAEAPERVNTLLRETMDALDLTGPIIELGLSFDIGSGAKRLSLAQQQKLSLGRALMKRPDLLIVNRALAALDGNAQDATVTRVLDFARAEGGPGFAVFWVLSHPGAGQWFDRVLTSRTGASRARTPARKRRKRNPSWRLRNSRWPGRGLGEEGEGHVSLLNAEVDLLRRVPLFAGIEPARLKLLAYTSDVVTYRESQVLFKRGDVGDAAYVIIKGDAEVIVPSNGGGVTYRSQFCMTATSSARSRSCATRHGPRRCARRAS